MNKITFYKLQSPYPEDVTKDCKLTMTEIDENFLNLKNNDISGATYNASGMTINVVKNNGDEIIIDLSELKYNIDAEVDSQLSAITEALSGITIPSDYYYYIGTSRGEHINESVLSELDEKEGRSAILYDSITTQSNDYIWLLLPEPITLDYWVEAGMPLTTIPEPESIEIRGKKYNAYRNLVPLEENTWDLTIVTKGSDFDKYGVGVKNIDLKANLSENGVLSLTWQTISGESSTTVSGFVTTSNVKHVTSFVGDGTNYNPLRLSNVEQSGYYKGVNGIVEILPATGLENGDRYITMNKKSNFGCLYDVQGMLTVDNSLKELNSIWRIPTKADWDKLLDYCEVCDVDCVHDGTDINMEYGRVAGKILKSVNYWEGNENLDKLNMTIFPTGKSNNESELEYEGEKAVFWTITEIGENTYFLKEFNSSADTVNQLASEDKKYSIRLVADYNSTGLENYTNLFGKEYKVVILKEINQIWMQTNLDYSLNNGRSDCFEYENATISNVHTLNHWNSEYWEKKELKNGDNIDIINNNEIEIYKVVNNINNTKIVKQSTIATDISGNTKTIIDSGWY